MMLPSARDARMVLLSSSAYGDDLVNNGYDPGDDRDREQGVYYQPDRQPSWQMGSCIGRSAASRLHAR